MPEWKGKEVVSSDKTGSGSSIGTKWIGAQEKSGKEKTVVENLASAARLPATEEKGKREKKAAVMALVERKWRQTLPLQQRRVPR